MGDNDEYDVHILPTCFMCNLRTEYKRMRLVLYDQCLAVA